MDPEVKQLPAHRPALGSQVYVSATRVCSCNYSWSASPSTLGLFVIIARLAVSPTSALAKTQRRLWVESASSTRRQQRLQSSEERSTWTKPKRAVLRARTAHLDSALERGTRFDMRGRKVVLTGLLAVRCE